MNQTSTNDQDASFAAKMAGVLYYRPRVEFHKIDFAFALGCYRFLFFSGGMRSVGAIHYRHVLAVLDNEDRDVLYVTAETNDLEPDIYLSRFTPRRRVTVTKSPMFAHSAFFIPIACMVAREALDLPYEEYPMTQQEDGSFGAIPAALSKQYPDGNLDEDTCELIAKLKEIALRSMPASIPENHEQ